LGIFGSSAGLSPADIAGAAVDGLLDAVEQRSLWNRFGL
jgi:hypothetical protein